MQVKIKRLTETAQLPRKAYSDDACYDICADEECTLIPFETRPIKTGLSVEVPTGYKLLIYPRSGLSFRSQLRQTNSPGVIDAGYRGEIHVILQCVGTPGYTISQGDRIAQIEIVPIWETEFMEVAELAPSQRGTNGLGSTGVRH